MTNKIIFAGRQEYSVDIGGERLVQHAPVSYLTSGNSLVNVNWQSAGVFPSSLMAVSALNWFSKKHEALLQFGWWNVSLIVNGEKTDVWSSKTCYEGQAVLQSQFSLEKEWGQLLGINASGVCPDDESAFVHNIQFSSLRPDVDLAIIVKIKGVISLGREVGSLFDGAGNMVTRGPGRTPALSLNPEAFDIFQEEAGLFSRISSNIKSSAYSFEVVSNSEKDGCDVVEFEIDYPVSLNGRENSYWDFNVILGNSMKDILAAQESIEKKSSATLAETSLKKWKEESAHMLAASMPVKILEAGFMQGLFYAKSNAYNFDGMTILHADHCSFPVDLSRDAFFISIALLYLKPDITKRHLKFYFEKAIPHCGVGTSYTALCSWKNKPGHFLLDAVIYPILELYRYWRFTGDGAYLKCECVRNGIDIILSTLQKAHSESLGLYRSEGRSSDEECIYPFFVPANMILVVMFEYLAEIFEELYEDDEKVNDFSLKAYALRRAIETHCVTEDKEFGNIYAFEVDGKGRHLFYDHADMPNLLTAPWFGYCSKDSTVYKNTLKFIYSKRNQGYKDVMDGRFLSLCDGSKTMPDAPWPISAMGRILTKVGDSKEVREMLDFVATSMSENLLIPEIVNKHTGQIRSRRWFAWPPALFVTTYIEGICGIKVGRTVKINPNPPDGWDKFVSPTVRVRGKQIRVCVDNAKVRVFVDGKETQARELFDQ